MPSKQKSSKKRPKKKTKTLVINVPKHGRRKFEIREVGIGAEPGRVITCTIHVGP